MARPALHVAPPGRVPDNPSATGVRPPDHTRGREPYLGLRLAEVVPRSRPLRQGGGGRMAVQRVVRREAANSSAPGYDGPVVLVVFGLSINNVPHITKKLESCLDI